MSIGRNGAALERLALELQPSAASLVGGEWRAEREWSATRLSELLSRAQLRAWEVETADGCPVLSALCPLGDGRALLAYARVPQTAPTPGALVVARSVPFGPRRYLLVGRPIVVAGAAAGGLRALIGSLRAPRGEYWHVHGAVIARAAHAMTRAPGSRIVASGVA